MSMIPAVVLPLAAALIPPVYAIVGGVVLAVLVSLPLLNRIRRDGLWNQLGTAVRTRPIHPVVPDPPTSRGAAGTLIDRVRRRVGHRPRSFDPALARYLHREPPVWLRRPGSDKMRAVYKDQERLRREGKVVWAAIVQANSLLFGLGTDDSPASVIWSDDPYYDAHPDDLEQLAPALFALKGKPQSAPDLDRFGRMLADERERAMRLPVSPRLTGGRAVYHSSLMFVRKQLPLGYVTGHLMPVWADPQPTGLILLVPAAFWPPALLDRWARP